MSFSLTARIGDDEFEASCWSWPAIWSFVCERCPFLTPDQRERGYWNDGVTLDANAALRIADAVEAALAAGETGDALVLDVEERTKHWREVIAPIFGDAPALHGVIDAIRIREFATFARHSGGFRID